MNVYSISVYPSNLVYIIKADNSKVARQFLIDHLNNVDCRVCSFVFFEYSFDLSLFDSYDPEILEVLSYSSYIDKFHH